MDLKDRLRHFLLVLSSIQSIKRLVDFYNSIKKEFNIDVYQLGITSSTGVVFIL